MCSSDVYNLSAEGHIDHSHSSSLLCTSQLVNAVICDEVTISVCLINTSHDITHILIFFLSPPPLLLCPHSLSTVNSEVDSESASVSVSASVSGNKASAAAAAEKKSKLKGVLSKMQSDNDNEETDQGMSDLMSKYQTKNKSKMRNI